MTNTNKLLEETEKLFLLSESILNLNSLEPYTDFPINELYIQLGHSDSVVSVDISPDGKYIISGSLDKTIRLWDIESGEKLAISYDAFLTMNSKGSYIISENRDSTSSIILSRSPFTISALCSGDTSIESSAKNIFGNFL